MPMLWFAWKLYLFIYLFLLLSRLFLHYLFWQSGRMQCLGNNKGVMAGLTFKPLLGTILKGQSILGAVNCDKKTWSLTNLKQVLSLISTRQSPECMLTVG